VPVRSALTIGAVVSAGFLLVFGLAGLLITAGFRFVIDLIPWLAIAVGIGVIGLGIALLLGYELTVGLPKAKRARSGDGYRSVFAFGVSYAVASLSCTLPVFLTVVATQVTRGTFVGGLVTFVAYGAGMSLVLVGVTIALAFGKQGLIARLRNGGRYISRISGTLLVLAGGYIVWFWGTSLASGADALGASGPFRFVEDLSQRAQNAIAASPNLVALILLGVIAAGIVVATVARRQGADVHD
jgi:cytochrome c biogenesis protein CcdA